MSEQKAIWLATLLAILVAGASLLAYGWNPHGLAATARNTARFSGILFALALLSRSPRLEKWFANRWSLFWAFVAAHGVHFGAVLGVVIFDVANPLHQMTPDVIVILAGGFGLVLATALTAGNAGAPFHSRVHSVLFYFVAASFASAFGARALHSPASAAVLGLMLLALLLRTLPARPARADSASA